MKTVRSYIIVFLLLLSVGCEKDNKTMLIGDIIGKVEMIDENNYSLQDRSNVNVSLISDTTIIHSITDQMGNFYFKNILYGNYQIDLEKNGFVKSKVNYTVHHLGGYSPTLVEYRLYEIPKFELVVDSIEFNGNFEISKFYIELKGNTGLPRMGYFIRCFCSNTPDVSKDNFVSTDHGWIDASDINGQFAVGGIVIDDYEFHQLESDSIFICIYPQAWGQQMYEYYQESLGEASNVISFMVE